MCTVHQKCVYCTSEVCVLYIRSVCTVHQKCVYCTSGVCVLYIRSVCTVHRKCVLYIRSVRTVHQKCVYCKYRTIYSTKERRFHVESANFSHSWKVQLTHWWTLWTRWARTARMSSITGWSLDAIRSPVALCTECKSLIAKNIEKCGVCV